MEKDKNKWVATAYLFSGRSNPEWLLTEIQQKNWMRLWQQARVSNADVKQPSILGYTGCRLDYTEHSHWHLYNGCVSYFENDKIFSKKDEKREMELFLLSNAPQEVKLILQDLGVL